MTNAYFQIGFRSSNGAACTINNLAYSTNGSSYTSFPGSISASGAFQYAGIQNPFSAGSLGRPFSVSYDIQPTVPDGVRIDSMFLANNTGIQTGGVLDFNGGNFEASSVPTKRLRPRYQFLLQPSCLHAFVISSKNPPATLSLWK